MEDSTLHLRGAIKNAKRFLDHEFGTYNSAVTDVDRFVSYLKIAEFLHKCLKSDESYENYKEEISKLLSRGRHQLRQYHEIRGYSDEDFGLAMKRLERYASGSIFGDRNESR